MPAAPRIGSDLYDRDHAGLGLELLPERPQRGVELAVREDPGPKPEDVVAQVADHVVELLDGQVDPLRDLRVARDHRGALEPHPHREQRLDDAVVELLGDPLAVLEQGEPLVRPMKAHVLDRGSGLDREHDESFFVVRVELGRIALVREVDVAEHVAVRHHRRAEERRHGRVVRRESVRVRMIADPGDAHRRGLADEEPEDPMADGRIADGGSLLVRDADRDELLDRAARRQDAECAVRGVRELDRELDDASKHDGKVELRGECQTRPDELVASIHQARSLLRWRFASASWIRCRTLHRTKGP